MKTDGLGIGYGVHMRLWVRVDADRLEGRDVGGVM